jgi:hypothetical protein
VSLECVLLKFFFDKLVVLPLLLGLEIVHLLLVSAFLLVPVKRYIIEIPDGPSIFLYTVLLGLVFSLLRTMWTSWIGMFLMAGLEVLSPLYVCISVVEGPTVFVICTLGAEGNIGFTFHDAFGEPTFPVIVV